jgi:hypothetical protein
VQSDPEMRDMLAEKRREVQAGQRAAS